MPSQRARGRSVLQSQRRLRTPSASGPTHNLIINWLLTRTVGDGRSCHEECEQSPLGSPEQRLPTTLRSGRNAAQSGWLHPRFYRHASGGWTVSGCDSVRVLILIPNGPRCNLDVLTTHPLANRSDLSSGKGKWSHRNAKCSRHWEGSRSSWSKPNLSPAAPRIGCRTCAKSRRKRRRSQDLLRTADRSIPTVPNSVHRRNTNSTCSSANQRSDSVDPQAAPAEPWCSCG